MQGFIKLKQVVDSLDCGVMLLNATLKVIYINEWIYKRADIHPHQTDNSHLLEAFPELKSTRFYDCCVDAVKLHLQSFLSNSFNPSPLPLYDPNSVGNELYRLQQSITIKSRDIGDETYCEVVISDVTASVIKECWLKRLANAYREESLTRKLEQTQLSRIIDNTADAILVFTHTGAIELANSSAEDLFGYTREEFEHVHLNDLLSKDQIKQNASVYDRIMLYLNRALDNDQNLNLPPVATSLSSKDGRKVPVEIKFSTSKADERINIITVIRDRTNEIESERIFRESENRFKTLAKIAPVGIFRTDSNGVVRYANETWLQVTGCKHTDLHQLTWHDIIENEERDQVRQRWHKSKSNKLGFNEEFCLRTHEKTNKKTWVIGNLMAEYDVYKNIIGFVGTFTDITQQRLNQEEIERMAYFDALTGLANRRYFKSNLDRQIKLSKRSQGMFALMALDLNGFKSINDTFGHDAGDKVLVEVAKRLTACVRESNVISRIGGDEFNILVSDYDQPKDLIHISKRILDSIKAPIDVSNDEVSVSTSIGITIYPGDAQSPEQLIKNADLALYSAKENKRAFFEFFNPTMNEKAEATMLLEKQVRVALDEDQFEIYYQPIIAAESGEICRAEALVRWRHPDNGLLLPAEFIAPLERCRIIHEFGLEIIRKVGEFSKELSDIKKLSGDFRISINMSPAQFLEPHFTEKFNACQKEVQFDWRKIEVEVTEKSFISNAKHADKVMLELQSYGVSFALDDFGLGYASLTHLTTLPIGLVKIDRAFIASMNNNPKNRDIVLAIIEATQRLGCAVAAEGVESEEQKLFLERSGCDLLQGFLIAKPMPQSQFLDFVDDKHSTVVSIKNAK
ncbi:sensor domain-containing protein [Sessilibacter corallicola]|uniref:GGDEF domain-containing protein n=1 Tax=Sessilibacter corallicola TaxID=2904075 RepID=A0ABQ0A8H6_9GAMM